MLFWGAIISKIISKKTRGFGESPSKQREFLQQQTQLEQQKREQDQKRLIAIGTILILIVGAIVTYQIIQKGKQTPNLG